MTLAEPEAAQFRLHSYAKLVDHLNVLLLTLSVKHVLSSELDGIVKSALSHGSSHFFCL